MVSTPRLALQKKPKVIPKLAGNKTSRGMGPQSDRKACWDHLAGQKAMMVTETRQFDFENGRSVQPNNPCMLYGRISDTGLYSFCYRRMAYLRLVMLFL